MANETVAPILPCTDVDETREFHESIGFRTTYCQRRPYTYLVVEQGAIALHFGKAPAGLDPAEESSGGAVVSVDEVAPYHSGYVAAMRATHGRVLGRGRPRITRLRPGATRFSLVDPSGNTIIVVAREEPDTLDHGGSPEPAGPAGALDNARVLRDFKNDDRAAYRRLRSALRRHRGSASAVERALLLAHLVGLGVALGESAAVAEYREELAGVVLDGEEQERVDAVLGELGEIREFAGDWRRGWHVAPGSTRGQQRGPSVIRGPRPAGPAHCGHSDRPLRPATPSGHAFGSVAPAGGSGRFVGGTAAAGTAT
ncbi:MULTISPECIES: glyoxalase [unclassified Pseudonocardia]|uniref:glyoxalase n=1 Tax=unclassified Pseudonocardia TaxID=2619320 RepID=UPI000A846308|nr:MULTISPECIES: glyoxalase [unclassified Pseudonocardia]